ncbi:MAG: 2-oxo-4-hydroxy-4-carboxy-5-ureidoimidazoline decarboxylase [Burkholderiaceae bacterium]|jgi:2-oxo-4-hydroxy-4-carboxy-5-ureidoimidazoline decarboxylase
MTSIAELDGCSPVEFVRLLDGVYEHSPWVAERAARRRPFSTLERLHASLQEEVLAAPEKDQLDLICAHPELIGQQAPAETMSVESRSEQGSVGLNRSTEAEIEQMRELNRTYRARFGFPFVIAVRGLSRDDIVTEMRRRTQCSPAEEFHECLQQIGKIARMRLERLIMTAR